MLNRLLAVVGGGGGFVSHVPQPFEITASPNGGWNHANDPHALYHAGYLYAGYVDGANGNVELIARELATGTTTTTVLKAALDANTHVSPSLLVRASDNKLLVVYSQHSGASIWRRLSTTSLDTDPDLSDGFAAETNLDSSIGGTAYTYPTLLQLLSETDDPIYLFCRDRQSGGSSGTLIMSTSTDGGETWSAKTDIFENGTKSPYWKVIGDGSTRIDIVTSDGRTPPDTGASKILHFWYEGGDWFASDGTDIGDPIFGPADLTEVYDGSDGTGWPMDLAYADPGEPVFTYAVLDDPASNDWRYGRWDGAAWNLTSLGPSNGVIEGEFAASVCLDPSNPNDAYAPVKVGSRWEIMRWRTGDGGATFAETAITESSAADNLQPVGVRNHSSSPKVIWQYGTYTDFNNFALGIQGV